MSRKWNNIFFVFGIAALILMTAGIDMDEALKALRSASYRFPVIIVLWALLYIFNTAAWYLIINAGGRSGIKFGWLYKVTVSGFALNYATPGGLMGGEPYRVMELTPHIGVERASSSVILYVMTHIFSHFWFWLLSVFICLLTQSVDTLTAWVLAASTAFCVLGLWFFISCYRTGLTSKLINLTRRMPLLKKRISAFAEHNREKIENIDRQTAALHTQSKSRFAAAVLLELACRFCSVAEIYIIMTLMAPDVTYVQCILILAFTSLFANLLFFMPLQIGGREGGFLMSAANLGLGAGAGIFTALIVRLRELAWTGIGLLLMKTERKGRS